MLKRISAAIFCISFAACGGETPDGGMCPPALSPRLDPAVSLPECVLPKGSIGAFETAPADPSTVPPDLGNGLSPDDATDAPATFPVTVHLRTAVTTFNRRYVMLVDAGLIWFKSNAAVTGIEQPWARLPMPECLSGTVASIGLDDDELIAVRSDGTVYGMDRALGDPSLFNWSTRWGAPVWHGAGMRLPEDHLAWTWTVVSPLEDGTWTDTAGNHPEVGGGKCSHIWAVRSGGQRLTLFDPWLPLDDSYEVCTPDRGRFRVANISASGSALAVVNLRGDIRTRYFDFDLGGYDPIFMRYSFDDQRGLADPAIQMPGYGWVTQPPVPGPMTLAISVHKVGRDMEVRILRVEGSNDEGATGYWEKEFEDAAWHFVETDVPLSRPLIQAGDDATCSVEGGVEDRPFARNMDQLASLAEETGDDAWAGELLDFNLYCSPATLRVHTAPGESVDLLLHAMDDVRQSPRARGLDANPRAMHGAIEVPADVLDSLASRPEGLRRFIEERLGGRRFTPVELSVTEAAVAVTAADDVAWTFAAQ